MPAPGPFLNMIYHYTCKCGEAWQSTRSITKGPLSKPRCPSCGTRRTEHNWRGPVDLPPSASRKRAYVGEKGFQLYDASKKTLVSGTIDMGTRKANTRTAEQQERECAKEVARLRAQAKETARLRKSSHRPHGEIRHIGSVPAEMHQAVVNAAGGDRNVWRHNLHKMLKRHGCFFGDD